MNLPWTQKPPFPRFANAMSREVAQLPAPDDLDEQHDQFRADLTEHLRSNPVVRRTPPADYSIERVEAALSRHLEELTIARATLAVEAEAAEAHLEEIKRKQTVIAIAHDTFAETLTKLTGRVAELEAPKDEPTEENVP